MFGLLGWLPAKSNRSNASDRCHITYPSSVSFGRAGFGVCWVLYMVGW